MKKLGLLGLSLLLNIFFNPLVGMNKQLDDVDSLVEKKESKKTKTQKRRERRKRNKWQKNDVDEIITLLCFIAEEKKVPEATKMTENPFFEEITDEILDLTNCPYTPAAACSCLYGAQSIEQKQEDISDEEFFKLLSEQKIRKKATKDK